MQGRQVPAEVWGIIADGIEWHDTYVNFISMSARVYNAVHKHKEHANWSGKDMFYDASNQVVRLKLSNGKTAQVSQQIIKIDTGAKILVIPVLYWMYHDPEKNDEVGYFMRTNPESVKLINEAITQMKWDDL